MAEFFTVRNDTKALTAQLFDTDGDAVDLTGATVTWTMTGPNGQPTKVHDGIAVTLTDDSTGKVSVPWTAVTSAGTYKGQFTVVDSGALIETFPSNGYVLIRVSADLDEA